MEINKQLFEDVLLGKLKGTFIKKAGGSWESKYLHKCALPGYPYYFEYGCLKQAYSETGKQCTLDGADIIDFIPETDMKENELTIEIPDGKEIDWDESKKQNKVVLKDKQLTYEEICEKLFSKSGTYHYVNNHGDISTACSIYNPYISNPNSATTKHQLDCILAKNKLANVAKYLNDGWKPSFDDISLLILTSTGISVFRVAKGSCASDCGSIWFKSTELAQQAIEILGEETVKLALEPLGI